MDRTGRHHLLRRHHLLLASAVAASLALGGCTSSRYVNVREVPQSPLVERLQLDSRKGPRPSDRTLLLLRRYDLADALQGDPETLFVGLQKLVGHDPSPENLYATAELAFIAGKQTEALDEKHALDMYGAAVAHAYMYLFDERIARGRNPYDPQFRGACDLYNGALESALRIVQRRGVLQPGCTHTIETATQSWDVTVVALGRGWHADEFERFEFVSDYDVAGLTNQYRTFGLGVPLIAVRKTHGGEDPAERFYPPGLSYPVTAFLRLLPEAGPAATGKHNAVIELHDPLTSTDVALARRLVPLESDLSTPLAYFLNDSRLNELPTFGLLRPDKSAAISGLYMLEPFDPYKIPVVMVHGLWSSPLTWTEMFNDLRSDKRIRDHYQFWFYLYPTGQPFWNSAEQMRTDLAYVRGQLDPNRRLAGMDQMVLVGHSMGGLVSKLQAVDSRNDYWNAVAEQPFHLIKASTEVRDTLGGTFFFRANPSVRRLITIGTPHRGSKFANGTTRYLARKFITLPSMLMQGFQEVYRENPGLFRNASAETSTSLDSLSPDSPWLPVLAAARPAPWVRHHNIIGVVPDEGILGRLASGSDGVVSYESAHLDNVTSELVITADHSTVHQHPLATLEVRRILLEHLRELRAPATPPPPTERFAGVPAFGPPPLPHVTSTMPGGPPNR